MPELPDVMLYLHCLGPRVVGQRVERVRVVSPFVLRTFDPPIERIESRFVRALRRMGKRIVFCFDDELFLVIHLMIAGRFRWSDHGKKKPKGPRSKIDLASVEFTSGALLLTEAGRKKRASIHVVQGKQALLEHDPGGIEPLEASFEEFATALRRENRTLKRSLTDPRTLSGIGNAYSDEILHRARLSPFALSRKLDDEQMAQLHAATQATLTDWCRRLIAEFGDGFPGPGEVTAFRPEMAVHGRFGRPCPDCGTTVQRIVHAENETNYCPWCQTQGRILADRSLSRLLRDSWPKDIEALEPRGGSRRE